MSKPQSKLFSVIKSKLSRRKFLSGSAAGIGAIGLSGGAFTLLSAQQSAFAASLSKDTVSLNSVDWHGAAWIGFTEDDRTDDYALRSIHPDRMKKPEMRRVCVSSLLRRAFTADKKVRTATVTVCGLGLHELYLNGDKVSDRVLDPASTSYDKHAFYIVHDVTSQIMQGQNAIGLMLGNGFYGQDFGFASPRLLYGEPRAKLVLNIEYVDGTSLKIGTNKQWKAAQSPIVFDNLFGGETFDARREQLGWSKADFDDNAWFEVERMKAPTKKLIEQDLAPIRKVRAIKPISIKPAENGEWIIDLGENIAGWLEIAIDAPPDTAIEMRFAELMMPNGRAIDTASTGVHATGCEQIDIYISNGSKANWQPRFTYHGFRYVQIKGLTGKPNIDDFTGWFVRTDLARTGTFACSDPMINRFYEVSMRTIEGNLHGLLSDCPHRERCAWLGDMHVSAETISMNFAADGLWRKHIEDFKTVLGAAWPIPKHYPEGQVPAKDPRAPSNVALGKRLCGQARPDWGMAVVLTPWFNWLYYGDQETAANAWPMMEDYLQFLDEVEVKNHLIKEGYAYGDWCPPGTNKQMNTSPQLTSSALYYQSNQAMAQMAKLLNKAAKAALFSQRAEQVKAAFNQKFFDEKAGHYGTQTATAMALNLGLVPVGKESEVAAGLNQLVMKENGGHYTTGIQGHRHLYTALNDYGYDATSKLLWTHTDFPSLGNMTEVHDLTTWPESNANWPAGKRYSRSSFNHPMQSGFSIAFHESIGGIRPDQQHPGFEQFTLKPCFLTGLTWAKADYDSVKGTISSHWQRKGNIVDWQITVPKSSSAQVKLPAGVTLLQNKKRVDSNALTLTAGQWQLQVRLS